MRPVKLIVSQYLRDNPATFGDVRLGARGGIVLLTGEHWLDLLGETWYECLFEGKKMWLRASILTSSGTRGMFEDL